MTDTTKRGHLPDLTWDKVASVPPTQSGHASRQKMYKEIAAAARNNPGDPFVIRGYATNVIATNMRKGKYPALTPVEDWEIQSRRNADGQRYDIYIRYIGKVEEEQQ